MCLFVLKIFYRRNLFNDADPLKLDVKWEKLGVRGVVVIDLRLLQARLVRLPYQLYIKTGALLKTWEI
ncbi:hypothetical protein DPMN_005778 [Dreissena polymorpha]|uniref:Uncharacterized protein n=1 Tax=Dreissena polymorpha TaxID=45954 RepID=A0A9D4RU86_DREPO|nr:hypothetical protein DPMN_005778 [Dreissena polymorpha]